MSDEANEPDLTDWERRKLHIYRTAAKDATREVLESFGFTIDQVEEMQRDLAFVRRLRVTSEAAGVKTVTSLVALIFAVLGAAGSLALQQLLK